MADNNGDLPPHGAGLLFGTGIIVLLVGILSLVVWFYGMYISWTCPWSQNILAKLGELVAAFLLGPAYLGLKVMTKSIKVDCEESYITKKSSDMKTNDVEMKAMDDTTV